MRKITKFPKLVIAEATNLRKFTTEKEKERLNFDILDPEAPHQCVYGLLTGYCYSNRAEELIVQCAPRVYHHSFTGKDPTPGASNKLNGKPKMGYRIFYWSPIERFIQLAPSEMNETLIDFIKGEKDKLE